MTVFSLRAKSLLKGAITLIFLFLAACSQDSVVIFKDYDEITEKGFFEKGWIPVFLPKDSTDIELSYNLDTNEHVIRLTVPQETQTAAFGPVFRMGCKKGTDAFSEISKSSLKKIDRHDLQEEVASCSASVWSIENSWYLARLVNDVYLWPHSQLIDSR